MVDIGDCLAHYHNFGVEFIYPDVWEVDEQQADGDIVITVSSSETCFWTLRIMPACPMPPQVVSSCVEAFEDEYDEVEISPADCELAGMPAYSRDLDFFCMELMNSVGLRSVRAAGFSLLVWWQGTHHELEDNRRVFDQMTLSVRIAE